MHSLERKFAVVAVIVLAVSIVTWAQPVSVGSGDNHALVVINFADGAAYEFDVAFALASINGVQAMDIIEAGSSLTTARQTYGSSVFVNGITYAGHSNVGYGGGENWWHYWVREPGQNDWTSPGFGASDRILINGGADGWVYGSSNPPVAAPEPATLGLLAAGGLALLRRRWAH